jgi:hypothetical protein
MCGHAGPNEDHIWHKEVSPMFFVVSSGRSGTQTIALALSSVPGCVCLHEPSPELILESSAYRYGNVGHGELAKILRETRQATIDGSVYCESNQTLSLIIPVLADVFPDARYIWLIRNGLDVVASAYQKQWYTGHSENHDRYEDCPPIEKAWIDGRIQGDRCGDMSAVEWANWDRFGRCCWYWSYSNRVIESDLNQYAPGRFFLLRLEDIDKGLRNLIDWMGFKVEIVLPIERHNIAKRVPYHWTQWSAEERTIFEHMCGDLMDRFYPSWRMYTGRDSEVFVAPALRGLRQTIEMLSEQLQQCTERLRQQSEHIEHLADQNRDLNLQLSRFKTPDLNEHSAFKKREQDPQ